MEECNTCNLPARYKCSKCGRVQYCGRDCQLSNWDAHRAECNSFHSLDTMRKNYIEQANKRILGNILIAAAHKHTRREYGKFIVRITETIEEFCKGHSFHVAYLYFEKSVAVTDHLLFPVVYKLDNYEHMLHIMATPQSVQFNTLHTKYPEPEDGSSVIFDL